MIFTKLRLWQIPILMTCFCLLSIGTINAYSDTEVCLNANLSEEQLAAAAVECQTAPVIVCPSLYSGCPGTSPDPSTTGWATATPGDADCPVPVVTYTDEVFINVSCEYELHRKWTATYPGNNTNPWLFADCTQIIILSDTNAPLIKNCPSDITVSMNSNCEGIATWNEPVYNDPCGISTAGSDYVSGSAFPAGTTTVTYTAYDNCGNSSTCSFNVTVIGTCCTAPPTITCPANVLVCPGSPSGADHPSSTGYATATPGAGCSMPIVTWSDDIQTNGCASGMKIFRTWTAMDPNNSALQTSCVQIINIEDLNAPTLTSCPSNITVLTSDANGSIINFNDPTYIDDCGIATINQSHLSGTNFPVGCTTVTFSGIDYCGNFTNCSFEVCVELDACNSAPIITCPPNRLRCPNNVASMYHPNSTGYATAVAGGPNCGSPVVTWSDSFDPIPSCPNNGMQVTRTWTAMDPDDASLTSTCVQIINLNDVTPPSVVGCPSNITVQAPSNAGTVVTWNNPLFTDDCGLESTVGNYTSGTNFPVGSTTVTYTATNFCGVTVSCSFVVTVTAPECNTPPNIACPANASVCINGDYSPTALGFAVATGSGANCGTPTVTYSDLIISTGSCTGSKVIERKWTATDPNNTNLFSTCIQNIEINDTQAPTITNCPSDIALVADNNCEIAVTWLPPTTTDNCGVASVTSTHTSGTVFGAGNTTVIYTVTDNCGNTATCSFNVIVTCNNIPCNVPPVLNCPANWTACAGTPSHPSTTGFATAVAGLASCDPPVVSYTDVVVSTGPCAGATVINRTWKAADPHDPNVNVSCVQVITLGDSSAPAISSCPSDMVVLGDANCQAIVTWTEPTVTDNCGVASVTSNYSSGSVFGQGNTTVTYTITDNCGNVSNCSFNIIVSCQNIGCAVQPVINCPADFNACSSASTHPSVTGYATANAGLASCDAPVVSYTDAVVSSGPCAGATTINRTWKATDPNDDTVFSTCVQIVSTGDMQAPVFNNCPGNITVDGDAWCDGIAIWTPPTSTDACGAVTVTSNYQPGVLLTAGNTTVIYTATDACGNVSTCSFVVTVTCNNACDTAPVINCPANVNLCVGSDYGPQTLGYATAIPGANCSPNPTITYSDQVISTGPCAGAKVIHRTWTATEPMMTNLTSSCVQVITLGDTFAPGIWECPSDITATAGSAVTWVEPSADDNCTLVSFVSSHSNGTVFPTGTTTVVYTATDACGNVSTCSFNVTVAGTSGNLTCPDDIVVQCTANGGAHVSWNPPVYSGSCGNCDNGAYIPGFIYMGTFGGSQYYCSVNPATWPVAEASCLANGGSLASISSAGENNFLANILTIQSAWIGLSDAASEGNFTWSNGEQLTYTNWYPQQPNDYAGNQDYVEMLSDGQWNDQYNYKALEYIMEIPCMGINQIAGQPSGSFFQVGTHTIKYALDPSCGNAVCSFTVTVSPSLTIDCPEDVTLTCPVNDNGMFVKWSTPKAESCCSDCDQGGQISGFIYMGSYEGNDYYCSVNPATWPIANSICQSNDGYLAKVETAGENNFLANLLTTQSAWIGLSDEASEGNFVWTDGSPLSGYDNWYPQQPNNYGGHQDFVEMLSNGEWNDQYNDKMLEFIMEVPGCVNVAQIAGPYSGTFFNAGTTTTVTYQAKDDCGNIETCSFDITIVGSECVSQGQNSNANWIAGIHFGDLNNSSGNDGGYADYTSHCANIAPGGSYPITLTPGFGGAAQKCFWKVWIDYNMDGDFTDANEYIAHGVGSTPVSGKLAIPNTGIWNGTTTMRVACKLGNYPTGPCETYKYGETEDYCIVITGADLKGDDEVESRSLQSEVEATLLSEQEIEIAKPKNSLGLSVFPNPATDYINIDHEDFDQIETINVFNATGKQVISNINIDDRKLDVYSLENGVYIITTRHKDGSTSNAKFIVQK